MKKLFFFAAATALLAACSQTDELTESAKTQQQQVEQTPVDFGVYVNKGTTRAGLNGDILNADFNDASKDAGKTGFGVFGYYTDDEAFTQYATPNFMYNQKVYKSSDGFTYDPIKYWPNEFGTEATSRKIDYLSFFAYAPWVDVDPVTGIVKGDKTKNIIGLSKNNVRGDAYVKYVASFDPANAVDLLWGVQPSSSKYAPIQDGSAWNAAEGMPYLNLVKEKTAKTGKVDFVFKHALSKLTATIDADVDLPTTSHVNEVDSKTKIFVRSVTFKGFAGEGVLNLNNQTADKPFWLALDYKSTLAGSDVTIYDGRQDGSEMVSANVSEIPATLNPGVVGIAGVISNPGTSTAKWSTGRGVSKTAIPLLAPNTSGNSYVYVIPNGDKLSVTIEYDVETIDPSLPGMLSDGKTHGNIVKNKITSESTIEFEAGKHYTIKLHLGMTSVKFDASVTGWDDQTGPDVVLPKNE